MQALTRRVFGSIMAQGALGLAAFCTGCTNSFQKPDPLQNGSVARSIRPKSLVICQDGTWNSFDGNINDSGENTNVAKIYDAVVGDPEQLVYYHNGVGQFGDRLLGGDLGVGTSQGEKRKHDSTTFNCGRQVSGSKTKAAQALQLQPT